MKVFRYKCDQCGLITDFHDEKNTKCVSCGNLTTTKIFESLKFDIHGHSESERKLYESEKLYWDKFYREDKQSRKISKKALKKRKSKKISKKTSKQILGEFF